MTSTLRFLDLTPVFTQACHDCDAADEARRGLCSFKRRLDVFLDTEVRDTVPGDSRLRNMERQLASFEGFKRSTAQEEFHRAMLNACLPHIYGIRDFERYRDRLVEERRVESIQQEVLVCCPRRFGKTTSVSMFVACMLAFCEDAWISCFSTGQRASTSLLEQAWRFLCAIPGGKERIIKKNQEQLFVRGDSEGDVRRFHSFPSSVQGLKGQVRQTPHHRPALVFLTLFS